MKCFLSEPFEMQNVHVLYIVFSCNVVYKSNTILDTHLLYPCHTG
jgi:hypothetical protein